MNALFKIFIGFYLIIWVSSCNSGKNIESEFKNHVAAADSVVCDGDPLNPTYAYLKNGNLIGLEFIAHPECGEYIKRYFINGSHKIEKIIIRKNYHSAYCENTYDSTYVILPENNTIEFYTKKTKVKEFQNAGFVKEELIDIKNFLLEINNWTR